MEPALRRPDALAWVESPLQLLCAIEAGRAGLLGARARIVPRAGVAALDATRRELRALPAEPVLGLGRPRRLIPLPRPSAIWGIGDAFSGKVQLAAAAALPGPVVIVDDGLATIHLLKLLTDPAGPPFLRARARRGGARGVLGAVAGARFRALARAGRLTVFTALPVPVRLARAVQDLGAELITHEFAWLRAQPQRHPPPEERTVVLGSALVRNGLVDRSAYLAWLEGISGREPVAYFPHRRETRSDLDLVRRVPGVSVYQTGAPVEMTLRGLARGQRVVSLPSTAVESLRLILTPAGVPVDVAEVPEWTAAASPELRSHLTGEST